MDYSVFEAEEWKKRPEESEQEHMERVIGGALAEKPGGKRLINDMLGAKLIGCDAQEKTLTLEFCVEEWMGNPNGTLHGGLLATASDMTMGILARYYKQARNCVTVQMSVDYLRTVGIGNKFRVCARALKTGRRVLFMSAEVTDAESLKAAGEVTAVFM